VFRNAVLELARSHPFARRLVNSGRLSVPALLGDSELNTSDADADFSGAMAPGAPAADAPVAGPAGTWLLGYLHGRFTLLVFDAAVPREAVAALGDAKIPCDVVQVNAASPGATTIDDVEGLAAKRYDARRGTAVLFRPDQHVCARWRTFDLSRVRAAIAHATAND
jgi:3-(3-hydroxy-phenyl)propionate hydroxylase